MRDYRKQDVWQKSHLVTLHVYKVVLPLFPKSEQFDLGNQLKRAAYSIPLNIAEGCGRNTDKDFVHFLDMALASCQEVGYCSLLASDLEQLDKDNYDTIHEMINEVKAKMINLIKSIRT